jgi:hypothetical protein
MNTGQLVEWELVGEIKILGNRALGSLPITLQFTRGVLTENVLETRRHWESRGRRSGQGLARVSTDYPRTLIKRHAKARAMPSAGKAELPSGTNGFEGELRSCGMQANPPGSIPYRLPVPQVAHLKQLFCGLLEQGDHYNGGIVYRRPSSLSFNLTWSRM